MVLWFFVFRVYSLVASSALTFQYMYFSNVDYGFVFDNNSALVDYLQIPHCDYRAVLDDDAHACVLSSCPALCACWGMLLSAIMVYFLPVTDTL
jgi:hypothetical protein